MIDRRNFLKLTGGTILGSNFLLNAAENSSKPVGPHFAPKAKKIIYLFMAGAPSQMETFDYKPKMKALFNQDLPPSIRQGQRVTSMTAGQARFPIVPSIFEFKQYGQSGAWVSELLPKTATLVDKISIIKTLHTEAIDHDPGKTLLCTGNQLPGMASLGAWLNYGLGSLNNDLPSFVVLNCAKFSGKVNVQGLYSRLWGSGFLPSKFQGVNLRTAGDPVLYIKNPAGITNNSRKEMVDLSSRLNQKHFEEIGDPEILTSIEQQQMAYRMQSSIPAVANMSNEPESVKSLYGKDVNIPGTFAYNCLLARKLIENNVRMVQLFHRGWDHHSNLPENLKAQCGDIDEAVCGLLTDLENRGLLEETLVVWGGEFGRTIYCQGKLTEKNYGRDHHPRCFTMWMAGAGVKKGLVYGETDDFSYNIVENPVHVHDLNATILHLMGLDSQKLSYPSNGLDMRLTGVEKAKVVKAILS